MAHIIIMPRQGNTVESCIIVGWKVKEGDSVTDETTVCDVETDKASFEVPAGAAGIVLKILCNAGDDVPVLSPIAVIGAAGEDWQDVLSKEQSNLRFGAESKEQRIESKDLEAGSKILGKETVNHNFAASNTQFSILNSQFSISPRARNLVEKEGLSIEILSTLIEGTGPGGRIIEQDVLAALKNMPALTAAAKSAVAAEGIKTIPRQGTGIGGRVTLEDIASSQSNLPTGTAIKGIRKIISDRMIKSLAETAQYTLNASASVAKLQEIRNKMKAKDDKKSSNISINDFILFAVSRVLPDFTYMNAHKTGDMLNIFDTVHLGMAVDTPRGLMVPVIRNANTLSLDQISSETKRLAAACKDGCIKPDELSGSTFSVSNLGTFGITSFSPILNIPEVAILGICGIELKPVYRIDKNCCCDCKLDFEPHIGFSLTINHQVVDGAPAAKFLKALCDAVAAIDLLLEGKLDL